MIRLPLKPKMEEIFDWAMSNIHEIYRNPDEDMTIDSGVNSDEPVGLLSTEPGGPAIIDNIEVIDDLFYRINDQYRDMIETAAYHQGDISIQKYVAINNTCDDFVELLLKMFPGLVR